MPGASGERPVAAILTVALLAATLLRLGALEGRRVWWHDEGISFLAAAGSQAAYHETIRERQAPYARWMLVSEWQRFVSIEGPVEARRVARELAAHDIHPPLYFWLLHLASLVAGVSVWTGPAMNGLLDLGTLMLVFLTARHVLGSPLWAAVAALLWGLSPATIEAGVEARQYALFGLVAIAFVLQFVRVADVEQRSTPSDLAILAALVCAGLLTHYYFAIFLVGAFLVASTRLSGRAIQASGRLYTAALAGTASFVAAHPWFVNSFLRAQDQNQDFQIADFVHRLLAMASANLGFFGASKLHRATAGVIVVALLVCAIASWRRGGSRPRLTPPEHAPAFGFVVWVMVGALLVLDLLYVGFISPAHAMGAKYLAPVWPLLAIVVAAIARVLPPRRVVAAGLCGFMLASTVSYIRDLRGREARAYAAAAPVRAARQVIIDNPARGVLFPLLSAMSAGQEVFVASQSDLLAERDGWLSSSATGPLLYATNPAYGNADDSREEVLAALAVGDWIVTNGPYGGLQGWEFYTLEPDVPKARRNASISGESGSRRHFPAWR